MKTPIPNSPSTTYDSKEHGRHTLYCGTEILQTRFYGNKHVLALVIRTGFSTTKGAVMRTLLYPAPVDYKFEKHAYKFVEFLAGIAGIGFVYTIVTKVSDENQFRSFVCHRLANENCFFFFVVHQRGDAVSTHDGSVGLDHRCGASRLTSRNDHRSYACTVEIETKKYFLH